MTDLQNANSQLRSEDQHQLCVSYMRKDGRLVRRVATRREEFVTTRSLPDEQGDPEDLWWLDFLRGNPESPARVSGSLSVADLFCGSGGLSLGASLAATSLGLQTEYDFSSDTDPVTLGIYRANHRPRFASDESVANLVSYRISSKNGNASYSHKPKLLESSLAMLSGNLDLLLAGPPCQGHSTVNNRTRFDDPRNLLYLAVPAIAVAAEIPALIIENVPGVTASRQGVVKVTVELLRSSGYEVTAGVLKVDELGWPQTRKRYFLVATRGWSPVPLEEISSELRRQPRPISWALNDVLQLEERSIMTELPAISPANQRRIDYLHDHELFDLPNDQRPDCHKGGTTYGAVYGRLSWDKPAPTLTTGYMTPGRGRFVHPLKRRTLLPREAARLQGFPDNYRFELISESIGRSAIAKGIGDAVPSMLGFAAGLAALADRPH